jgi:hypothetical protein
MQIAKAQQPKTLPSSKQNKLPNHFFAFVTFVEIFKQGRHVFVNWHLLDKRTITNINLQ